MHTPFPAPTLDHLTPDDRDTFHDLYRTIQHGYGAVDLGLLAQLGAPLLLVQGPICGQHLLVADDGRVAALHHLSFDDFGMDAVRRMVHPDPIGLFLAAGTPEAPEVWPDTGVLTGYGAGQRDAWTVVAVSAGARAHHAAALDRDGARALLDAFFDAWCADMEDPFFVPMDSTTWTHAESASMTDLFRRMLDALGCPSGVYQTNTNAHTTQPFVTDEDGNSDGTMDALGGILAAFFPDTTFQGTVWEYNDGAHDRRSGYDEYDATVCVIDHTAPSVHTRLQAIKDMAPRIATLPKETQRLWAHLIGNTHP